MTHGRDCMVAHPREISEIVQACSESKPANLDYERMRYIALHLLDELFAKNAIVGNYTAKVIQQKGAFADPKELEDLRYTRLDAEKWVRGIGRMKR